MVRLSRRREVLRSCTTSEKKRGGRTGWTPQLEGHQIFPLPPQASEPCEVGMTGAASVCGCHRAFFLE